MIRYHCQIILAWIEDTAEPIPDPHRRIDIGEAPRFRPVRIPRAVRWCNEGLAADVEAAERFVAANAGHVVFCYGPEVEDAMGAARRDVLRGAAPIATRERIGR